MEVTKCLPACVLGKRKMPPTFSPGIPETNWQHLSLLSTKLLLLGHRWQEWFSCFPYIYIYIYIYRSERNQTMDGTFCILQGESFSQCPSRGGEVWDSFFGCEICESLIMFTIGHDTKNNGGSLGCNRHHLSPWWQEVEFFLAHTKLNFPAQSARALTFYTSTENEREKADTNRDKLAFVGQQVKCDNGSPWET